MVRRFFLLIMAELFYLTKIKKLSADTEKLDAMYLKSQTVIFGIFLLF